MTVYIETLRELREVRNLLKRLVDVIESMDEFQRDKYEREELRRKQEEFTQWARGKGEE